MPPENYIPQAVESHGVITEKAVSVVSYGGAAASVGSAMTLPEIGIIVGIVTAVATFLFNMVWQYRKDAREQVEHKLRMEGLLEERRYHDEPVSKERRKQS